MLHASLARNLKPLRTLAIPLPVIMKSTANSPEMLVMQKQECSIGPVLVASSQKGVCALLIGEDISTLEAEVRQRCGPAKYGTIPNMKEITQVIDNPFESTAASIPLDLRGTPFQVEVWSALCDIPPGETRTYGAIAQAIGRPTAARATGAACGANMVALLVPCHRVLGSKGALTGFRWGGVSVKQKLLERETSSKRSVLTPSNNKNIPSHPEPNDKGSEDDVKSRFFATA